ncbi:sulfotransferase family 2 domain-containing protein [Marinobacter sp. MDS2]|uniref:sulfotransferase family 2 domain-containing protein n=1 Tax=Marinobacter sp. MDS2 TaxID=3065961 RepID=UPI00273AAEC0|nr:sulfotransferase family 2 domain-containing protein [Marinobacter sp. MDS2]MDP4546876.1 sulfotransferase family 2 domain-containing protein [Marinobacter sp. MDS2]
MPVFSKGKVNILFLHIPKSAGSTIEKIADDFGWEESFSIRGKSLKEIRYCKASLQHLHVQPLESILEFEQFDSIFTVVRNPFSRFKSEYYWQRTQGITELSVDDWVSDTFEKYLGNSYIYDNHIRPQVEFIPRSPHQPQVFKLEEGGVERAKKLFLGFSNESENRNSWAKWLTSLFTPDRQEKRSLKYPEIEAKFERHYDRIVEFYKQDYSTLSYKI